MEGQVLRSAPSQSPSELPGILLSLVFLGLAVLTWPIVLGDFLSLDWRIGNMRPVAYGLQAVFASLAIASWTARRLLSSFYFRVFPTRKKFVFGLVVVLFSFVLSLAAAEIACRLFGLPFESKPHWTPAENALAQFDEELGWSYLPNRTVVQEFGREKRKVAMHFNEIGARVSAPGVRYDPSAPTVLFVGDSYAFGHGLPYEETFVGLAATPGFPFQVVNLAVQGYGTDQALLLLKRHFKKFNTKAVVYTYIDEVISRNANYDRRILYRDIRILGTKPLFALNRDGTVYLNKLPVRYEHLRYSRLGASLQVVWNRWGPKPSVELTRALVQDMRNYVESNGAKFIVVFWYQRDYSRWNPPPTLGPGESPFCGMDLQVIDTTASAPPDWSRWLIQGDEHPNARAHARVAQLILEELRRILKPEAQR
jgi:hypothetical protein